MYIYAHAGQKNSLDIDVIVLIFSVLAHLFAVQKVHYVKCLSALYIHIHSYHFPSVETLHNVYFDYGV